MAGPPIDIPPFRVGQRLEAQHLNQIVDALLRRVQGSPGLDVRSYRGQLIFTLVGQDPLIATRIQMQVQSGQGDYLICRTLDANGVVGPADIFVQKPWVLRRTPFENLTVNGVAYTYSANGTREADGTETQKITQDYFLGAEIMVERTNVSMLISPGVFTTLIDTNDSSREWCEPE